MKILIINKNIQIIILKYGRRYRFNNRHIKWKSSAEAEISNENKWIDIITNRLKYFTKLNEYVESK